MLSYVGCRRHFALDQALARRPAASSNGHLDFSPFGKLSESFASGATRRDWNCKWCASVCQPVACHRFSQVQLDGRIPGLKQSTTSSDSVPVGKTTASTAASSIATAAR